MELFRAHQMKFCLGLILLISLVACSGQAASNGEQIDDAFRVAAVFPGQINDNSWNAAGYEGLQSIESELGAEIAFVENVTPARQVTALRNFASQGFDLVIAHGGQYQTAVMEIAAEFPDTQFVTIAGTEGNSENVNAYSVDFAQFNYVLGFVGAKITETGQLGLVTGLQGLKTVTDSVSAFRLGAKAANPEVSTTVVYLTDNEDPSEARAASEALVDSGVDVLYLAALNAANQGVFQVAAEQQVWTNAEYVNLTETAPEIWVSNIIYNWSPLYLQAAEAHQAGDLQGGVVNLGFADDPGQAGGWLEYDSSNMFNPRIPSDVRTEAENLVGELASGDATVPPSSEELAEPGTQ